MKTPAVVGTLSLLFTVTSVAQQATISVVPALTDEILANPGMGWQTFHRTARQDKNLPDWIPSTVHYARWGWGELEPELGKLNVEFLDRVLAESRASGQRLAFRVMCASTYRGRPYHPRWLVELGGRELECRYGDGGPFPVPDLDHPVVLRDHLDFIRRLGAQYDGHPDIDHVDLGTVGWWAEWHMSQSDCAMPAPATQRAIVDAYLQAFRQTTLLVLMGGGEMLTYAAGRRPQGVRATGAAARSPLWPVSPVDWRGRCQRTTGRALGHRGSGRDGRVSAEPRRRGTVAVPHGPTNQDLAELFDLAYTPGRAAQTPDSVFWQERPNTRAARGDCPGLAASPKNSLVPSPGGPGKRENRLLA